MKKIYTTVYSDNISLDISIINYFKANDIQFIYRNNCFFLRENDFKKYSKINYEFDLPDNLKFIKDKLDDCTLKNFKKKSDFYIHNYTNFDSESIFYSLTNNYKRIYFKKNPLLSDYKKIDELKIKSKFEFPKSKFFSDGIYKIVYFKGNLVSNPNSILTNIFSFYEDKDYEKYFSIMMNYEIYSNYIIYYFIFHYGYDELNTKNIEIYLKNFSEFVNYNKKNPLKNFKHNDMNNAFEKKYLSEYTNSKNLNNIEYLKTITFCSGDINE
ncbi:hypothetical protein OSSY52_22040 [Tepiditoga spiralis]|uniref:Uncharacterized protein n=1 Tax=Tepiditoga spiralis TaxID=2108365 RepID=A0A7G1GAC8_9BACT|nr:hypothetical protein [Tepiditoga spiralis]BBE32063.1 hypothetical protein OSSY52_22040 [Tepiditoga spiralis]